MTSHRGLEPGDAASRLELPDAKAEGAMTSLSDAMGPAGLVIAFTCNHCPYVVASETRIEALAERCRAAGIGFIGINSNDPVNYPADDWPAMVSRATSMSYSYLHDAEQSVARAYGAERTPEFYLVDANGAIVYRGRLDDSPTDPRRATTSELSDAIDAMLTGAAITPTRTDSIGCSVKWAD